MIIKGLQKTTLIDYPGKIACTLFLFGCNFKCGYCHNPELVLKQDNYSISEEEVLDFLLKRREYLDGICITGGEPTLSINKDFLKKIKDLGYSIKIDTNGTCPEKLKELIRENLVDFIAMDIKASKENYEKVVNAKVNMEDLEESIKIISSIPNYEFRTTIVNKTHNQGEIKKIAKWLNDIIGQKPKIYFLQGFKNKGKILDKSFESEKDISEEKLIEFKTEIENFFDKTEIRV